MPLRHDGRLDFLVAVGVWYGGVLLGADFVALIDLVKISYDKDKFRIKIWNGSSSYLDVKGANKDGIFVNLPKNLKNPKIRMELEYEYPLQLPIKKFEKVGVLRVYNNKEFIEAEDLFAQKDITDKNIFFKGIQNINHYLWR